SAYKEPNLSGKVTLSYLSIPICYLYEGQKGFYAEAGLQPGLLLSAKDKYNGRTDDYKGAMRKFELGIPVGAGYRTKMGLGFGARVIWGIINNQQSGKGHNLLLMALLSYRIGFSRRN